MTLPPQLLLSPGLTVEQVEATADHGLETTANREPDPPTHAEALVRLQEAEDTLRAIGVGEIDAFVVSDGASERRVFTLSTADRPYRRFVETMRDGAATVSPAGVILYANRRLAELLSCSREAILGSRLTAFMSRDVAGGWESVRASEGDGSNIELDLIDVRGRTIPVLVGVSPLGEDGDLLTCLTFTDLSAQKAQDREISRLSEAQADRLADLQHAQAALIKQATHDGLTGLPNREILVDRIGQALLRGGRSRHCTAVFFIDLDSFKRINDTRGHAVGDLVLRGVAHRLIAVMREMDTVARIGGDEFVVLAPEIATRVDAVAMGSRLVEELARVAEGAPDGVCASIGIAVSEGGRGTAELMLHEADTAMYQAKSQGGGRTALFDGELARQAKDHSTAAATLRAALDDRRVVPYYQTIVDLESGAVAGFEALARLIERDGTILSPASFIAVAEDTGLVLPLGAQMLERACEDACRWPGASTGDDAIAVAVNVSSCQLQPGDLAGIVRDILARTGLSAPRLHLELTETAIIDLHPEILRQLSKIRELGVQIGLDDFGTGYASLTHLRRLPLDFVKVDGSFVKGLGSDAGDERIVSAVIDLARKLGLRSIGEGVETTEQLRRLRELGCDQAQGYLFARPAALDKLTYERYGLPAPTATDVGDANAAAESASRVEHVLHLCGACGRRGAYLSRAREVVRCKYCQRTVFAAADTDWAAVERMGTALGARSGR
jgi:diguanylate cyclase (GGDEF)-like protein/PAS domain S-box-containing protein